MAQFTKDDKKEIAPQTNGFYDEGVYPVTIVNVTGGESSKGSEFFEFEVTDEDGREGKVQVYFSEKAKGYSFNTVRSIFVHNAKTDAAKEETRDKINAVNDTKELLALCGALRGCEAWLLVQNTGDTYTSEKSGKTYNNVNRNIYGYEPELRPRPVAQQTQAEREAAQEQAMGIVGGGEVTKDNIDDLFPFGDK